MNAPFIWSPGPPPGRGRWWVVLRGGVLVHPVVIEPALIHAHDSDAPLLVKTLGGVAYDFASHRDAFTHHAELVPPESP